MTDETEGCASPEIAATGNALVWLCGLAVIVFTAWVLYAIVESVREAPPRCPPFSELPADPAGRAK